MKVFNTGKFTVKYSLSFLGAVTLLAACQSCSSVKGDRTSLSNNDVHSDSQGAVRIDQGDGIHLSQALKQNLKIGETTPEREKVLRYISRVDSLRHRRGLHADPLQPYQTCLDQYNSEECIFLKPSWSDSWMEAPEEAMDFSLANPAKEADEAVQPTKLSRRKSAKLVARVVQNIRKGMTTKLADQREGDYYRAFKKFSNWRPELQSLAEKLLGQSQCADPELYAYLGLKSEEYFPSQELLTTATRIYERADQCATQSPATQSNRFVQMSRFRLGLLEVMQDRCALASPVFTRLAKTGITKSGGNDYTTRALYWDAFCRKSDSKKEEFLSKVNELFRTNPMGFHTLTINHGDSILLENLGKPIDPIVQTRATVNVSVTTSSNPALVGNTQQLNLQQLNLWISVIEDFDRMGDYAQVRKLLLPLKRNPEYLNVIEPGVRLYLSSFAYRAKDTLSLFRILDSVFRTQSEYVVDSTLRLFYPMKFFDSIVSHVKTVNPLLITALVRQESAFQDGARSKVGAVGLMQLMPHTARLIERRVGRRQLMQPDVNLRIGIHYFENLVARYNGDVELALAAYNAGPIVVDQWEKRYPMTNRLLFLDLIPFSETRNYVTLIGRNYYWYSKIYIDLLKTQNGVALAPVEFRSMKSN